MIGVWRRTAVATRTRGPERATGEAERVLDLLNSLGSTTFRQLLWQRASELDLTYAQSQVLFYVAEHPGAHMGDVAKAFGVTLPAVTHIVDRLEQKAFLVRGDHPADRRIYMLDLTRAGKALVEELQAMRQRQAEVQQAIANLERDTAQLANARVQERRYKALVEKELVAREQYDQLQTNLAAMEATVQADRAAVENAKASERAAQANVDNARLQLGYTEIRAPIDGRTGNLLVQNGNVIKANDDNPPVVINQVHPIYVSFSVPEQHLADIRKYRARGPLRVEARLPRQLETIATGELTFINNAVDQTTG